LKDYMGKAIVLGIRPEHVIERPALATSQTHDCLEAVVEAVEQLGGEGHLRLTASGNSFVGRYFGEQIAKVGQRMLVAFDMSRAHFFDSLSQRRIRWEQTPGADSEMQ